MHYNELIDETLFRTLPNNYLYKSDILNINSNDPSLWELDIPKTDKNYLILHVQDFIRGEDLLKIEHHQQLYNIKNIVLIHWNHNLKKFYNGSIKLIEFPSHSYELVNELIERYNEWNFRYDKTVNFMCLNGIPKRHRKLTFNYLNINHYGGITTLSDINNGVEPYSNYNWDNIENFVNLRNEYKASGVNIITESLYTDSSGILSEKTLFAFASMQLPIMIAHKGAVSDARRYGFDMFDDIIDHSYDTMPNNIRWKKALTLNRKIIDGKYHDLEERLISNKQYLLQGYLFQITKHLIKELSKL
jgi:hypothetical protein